MKLSLFLDPQEGISYATLREATLAAERLGFHGMYRSDHLTSTADHFERAASEAWSTLAGLARETSRLRLGTLVTPVGFRHPSLYAKIINTVDEMSDGRVDVSIGTGWYAPEHLRLGLPFPELRDRFDQLEEYLAVLHQLWGTSTGGVEGQHYRVDDFTVAPASVQRPRPRLILGGHGPRRTPRIAARYADDYNVDWLSPEETGRLNRNVDNACADIGRDPAEIERSILVGAVIAADRSDVDERLAQAGRFLGLDDVGAWREKTRESWTVGTAEDLVVRLQEYAAVGVQHTMLMLAPGDDLDIISLVADVVMPAVAGS
ncbi:TIGR03560 family F420-dependent LLM class oxidoreductase [Nakamurella sp. YIM 132087]|uniref:TIGR03560 family F420-dependent LLM class oxidoreductase n=1 Tax=Nakamurella alba TaxID=2665158 RepID=A0A7K1FSE0_9ACTN|nr:TIGR03560 family F420-dependent LLM class oxidoreductase [Nakamurella alba]MTD16299.1 TIGR03560 family F420-dependent LLM class oxidoreductase [Nakamurella alba]